MAIPTLVVSNPPHGEVDLEAAGRLLQLDPFATRLKAVFAAPEIMEAGDPDTASQFADALRSTGFEIVVMSGAALAAVPWPDPVQTFTLDDASVRMTTRTEALRIPYEAEVVAVYCRPPEAPARRSTLQIERAIASEHGPTIAEAIHRQTILDLYFRDDIRDAAPLRRATILPDLLGLEGERAVRDLKRRLERLRLDDRLAGVRPRAPYHPRADGSESTERRRYSFGTANLYRVLDSIAPELRAVPQYELGSRLACALSPLAGATPPD